MAVTQTGNAIRFTAVADQFSMPKITDPIILAGAIFSGGSAAGLIQATAGVGAGGNVVLEADCAINGSFGIGAEITTLGGIYIAALPAGASLIVFLK